MSAILAKVSVKPLLLVVGLQLVAILALGGWLHVQRAQVGLANAKAAAEMSWAAHARTERDVWKATAQRSLATNEKWHGIFETMQGLLAEAQGERRRLETAGQAVIAAAQSRAEDADRTLAAWMGRYAAQVRADDCAAALHAVQQACPAFERY